MVAYILVPRRSPQWTNLPLSGDSAAIYVANSGDDGNSGLNQGVPLKTAAAAKTAAIAVGNAKPTHVRFKCGDSWTETLGDWTLNGRSAAEPFVIESYGVGARPIFNCGTNSFINLSTAYNNNTRVSNVALAGLELYGSGFSGSGTPDGIGLVGPCSNWLLEDLYVHNFFNCLDIQGINTSGGHPRSTNIRLRYCNLDSAYSTGGGNPQGMYIQDVDQLTVEGMNYTRCGWLNAGQFTQFRHAAYIQAGCTDVRVIDCVNAGTDEIQVRPGGIVRGNVASRTVLGLTVGYANSQGEANSAGNIIYVEGNVCLELNDAPDASAAGMGIRIGNAGGGRVRNNIIANCTGTDGRAIWILTKNAYMGSKNVAYSGNIAHNAGGAGFLVEDDVDGGGHPLGLSAFTGNTVDGHVIQNPTNVLGFNDYAIVMTASAGALTSSHFAWSNSHMSLRGGASASKFASRNNTDRTLAQFKTDMSDTTSDGSVITYANPGNATLGKYWLASGGADQGSETANHDALLAQLRLQSRQNWRTKYGAPAICAYVKACFT